MKKFLVIMMILSTIALSSCYRAFNVGNAEILITNMVGLDNCRNIKCINIKTDGTAYYVAVDKTYTIRTFVVDRHGNIEEE